MAGAVLLEEFLLCCLAHTLFFLTLASHPYSDKSLIPHHCRVTAVLATFLLPGGSVIVNSSLEQHQDHSIN